MLSSPVFNIRNIAKILTLFLVIVIVIGGAGSSYIEASADFNNGIYLDTQDVDTGIVAAGNPLPDLIVKEITLSPEEPTLEDAVIITATIKNQGTSKAVSSYVNCYVDDISIGSKYVDALDAGKETTTTFTWVAQVGSHTIRIEADATNQVSEEEENNNTNTFTFSTVAVDLIIQSISWSPADPSRGDSVVFSITVKNQGTSMSNSTNIEFYIDGGSRGSQDIYAINAGGTVVKTYNWVAKTGQHSIKATVDELNNVTESNEGNNEQTVTFSTLPPDLVVQDITWSPENPSKNDVVTFTAEVKNQGSGRSDSCYLAFYIDDTVQPSSQVSPLESGDTENITITWAASAGLHDIEAIVDCYNKVPEGDESNNENKVTFLTLAPDLLVKDVTWSPTDAAVGDTVTFSVTIRNQGSGKAEGSRTACYVGGKYMGYIDFGEINTNSDAVATFQWEAVAGSHGINIVANYDNKILENNINNNRYQANISVIPPDLVIPNIICSPESPSVGDIVTFTVNITNQGGGVAQSFRVAYYLDEEFITSDYVGSIAAGASANKTCTWKSLNGLHTFKAVADFNTCLVEADEDNNGNSVTIVPNIPDLIIDNIIWKPLDLPAGEEVTFNIRVRNQGSMEAGPSRVAYYIDGSIVGYEDIGRMETDAVVKENFSWIATPGSHTVKIVADSNNQVFEGDENNNSRTVNLPPPDMTIQNVRWSPTEFSVGDAVVITADILNQGIGKTLDSRVTYYVDGQVLGYQELPEIGSGEKVTATFDWVAEVGTHIIGIITDPDNLVTETDETNNAEEAELATLAPDLLVQDISWSIEDPLSNEEVTVVVIIKNQGSGKAGRSRLSWFVDDEPISDMDIREINAGDTVTETFIINVKEGEHSLSVVTDASNKVTEIDEANNEKNISFSSTIPDLVVTDITWMPVDAAVGDTVTFFVNVQNQGRQEAKNSRLVLYIDEAFVASCDIEKIEAGDVITRDFAWIVEDGSHDIRTYVDLDEMVLESNEANNEKQETFSLTPEAEPVQQTVQLNPVTTESGGLLEEYWWLLLITAILLIGVAFFVTLKSLRRE